MNCLSCSNPELVVIQAHARDCFNVDWYMVGERVKAHDGYFPSELEKLGVGDDMCITVCLKCASIQELLT